MKSPTRKESNQARNQTPSHARRTALRNASKCVHGQGREHPSEEFERVAKYIRDHHIEPDVYGTGLFLEEFEREVAELLGTEAARFLPSGCMAQPIALRIWAERAKNFETAFHPTSHLEIHEEHGYRELHGLKAHLLGDETRPTVLADLTDLPAIGSLLVELPAREIGGQLPTWGELVQLSDAARSKGIRLHLDGARLWEAQAFYNRPHAEICALFDSVYVSFYKGIGALAGAMLLGPQSFIDEAKIWQRRQGGTLISSLGNIVSAKMRLKPQIAKMHSYRARAEKIAAEWTAVGVEVLPTPPQVNMFHLRFEGDKERLLQARDTVAEEHGVWLFGALRPDGDFWRTEICILDAAEEISGAELSHAIAAFSQSAS